MSIALHVNMPTMTMSERNSPSRGGIVVRPKLGQLIYERRKKRGLSQWDLAHAVGSDQGYISKLERGERPAPDEVLRAIAPLLGVPFRTLVLARSDEDDEVIQAVEGDRREYDVRYAGIMPADRPRWCEVQEQGRTMRVWEEFLDTRAPEECFVVKVSGDCLVRQHIANGYYVLLRDLQVNETPKNGAIVAVRIDDEFSLKIWGHEGSIIRLSDGDGNVVFEVDTENAERLTVLGIYMTHWPPKERAR